MRRVVMANEGLALGALLVAAGCFARTAKDAPGASRGAGTSGGATMAARRGPPGTHGRLGVAIVAEAGVANRGAAEALVSPLAAACLAQALGVARSTDECVAAARERRLQRLVVCRVIEYDPYDPARLVVRLVPYEIAAGSHLSPDEAAALGRSFGAAAESAGAPRRPAEATVSVDLGARSEGWFQAYAREQGMGVSDADLLEAEVLLRDPARFFPFAARQIAARAPHVKAGTVDLSTGGRGALHAGEARAVPVSSGPRPPPRSLGVPDDLR